jgi:hypothetical protein
MPKMETLSASHPFTHANPKGAIMKTLVSICSIAALAASAVYAQTPTFAPLKKILAPNSSVNSLSLYLYGNFNGNGNTDLLLALGYLGTAQNVKNAGKFEFYTGDGTGNFTDTATVDVGLASSALVSDVNGDGRDDIITLTTGCVDNTCVNPGSFNVLLSQGNGTFTPGFTTALPAGFGNLEGVVGDFNKDGKPDIAVLASSEDTSNPPIPKLLIFLNQGNGTFSQTSYQLSPSIWNSETTVTNLVIGDFEGNGNQDLAFVVNSGIGPYTKLYTFAGNGKGGFGPAVAAYEFNSACVITGDWNELYAADLNGDGRTDLVLPLYPATSGNFRVPTLLAEVSGKFDWFSSVSVASPTGFAIALSDVNGDGKPDLVFVNSIPSRTATTDEAGIYLGLGNGTFKTPHVPLNANGTQFAFGFAAVPLKTGDLPSLIIDTVFPYLALYVNTTGK